MRILTALIILLAGTSIAFAKGNPKAGKAKAATCVACHGQKGISSNDMWPNLAGQKKGYLAKAIKDFKSGKRKDPVMSGLASAIKDADIADIAAYFNSLK